MRCAPTFPFRALSALVAFSMSILAGCSEGIVEPQAESTYSTDDIALVRDLVVQSINDVRLDPEINTEAKERVAVHVVELEPSEARATVVRTIDGEQTFANYSRSAGKWHFSGLADAAAFSNALRSVPTAATKTGEVSAYPYDIGCTIYSGSTCEDYFTIDLDATSITPGQEKSQTFDYYDIWPTKYTRAVFWPGGFTHGGKVHTWYASPTKFLWKRENKVGSTVYTSESNNNPYLAQYSKITLNFYLVVEPDVVAPTLVTPSNGATLGEHDGYFMWQYGGGQAQRRPEWSANSSFTSPVHETSSYWDGALAGTGYDSAYPILSEHGTGLFYWRVRVKNSSGYEAVSSARSYTVDY